MISLVCKWLQVGYWSWGLIELLKPRLLLIEELLNIKDNPEFIGEAKRLHWFNLNYWHKLIRELFAFLILRKWLRRPLE
jgi:hypothetical protein